MNNSILLAVISYATVLLGKIVSAPFEIVKLRLQSQPALLAAGALKTPYAGILDCLKRIVREEGFFSLFNGYVAMLFRWWPVETIDRLLQPLLLRLSKIGPQRPSILRWLLTSILPGTITGILALIVVYPLDLAHTLVANDVGSTHYSNIFQCLWNVFRKHGFTALYSGLTISIIGIPLYRLLHQGLMDSLRRVYKGDSSFIFTLAGVVVAQIVGFLSYPLDTLRRRLMVGLVAGPLFSSWEDALINIIAKDGFFALFAGVWANVVRGLVATAMILLVDLVKSRLVLRGVANAVAPVPTEDQKTIVQKIKSALHREKDSDVEKTEQGLKHRLVEGEEQKPKPLPKPPTMQQPKDEEALQQKPIDEKKKEPVEDEEAVKKAVDKKIKEADAEKLQQAPPKAEAEEIGKKSDDVGKKAGEKLDEVGKKADEKLAEIGKQLDQKLADIRGEEKKLPEGPRIEEIEEENSPTPKKAGAILEKKDESTAEVTEPMQQAPAIEEEKEPETSDAALEIQKRADEQKQEIQKRADAEKERLLKLAMAEERERLQKMSEQPLENKSVAAKLEEVGKGEVEPSTEAATAQAEEANKRHPIEASS